MSLLVTLGLPSTTFILGNTCLCRIGLEILCLFTAMGFKPSVGIRSEVSDPILTRVHLWLEVGLPATALLSLLLVAASSSAQSLFPVLPDRILLGKVVDCHPSGFVLILLWRLAASFLAFSDLGIADVLALSLANIWTTSQNRPACF